MSISQEKLDSFQARMSAWVSSQGILFQLTHAGGVQGARSSLFTSLIKLAFRLGILAVVVLLGFTIYLSYRTGFASFREHLSSQITAGLAADEAEIGGVRRERGYLHIAKISMSGGEESFFDVLESPGRESRGLELRGVRTKMGLLDGVLTKWKGENIGIAEMVVKVRAGAENDEDGATIFSRLFAPLGDFKFSSIDVEDATVKWGYSAVTQGSIRNAHLEASRVAQGWNVKITGGTFSQNWLKRLEIDEIQITIRPEGVEITNARLKQGDGVVTFKAKVAGSGTNPKLSGEGSFSSLSIAPFLLTEVRPYLGGEISGEFTLDGSLYAQEGVRMSAEVELKDAGDLIELRDAFQLFTAISVVDRMRSYKNVRFREGRFRMETGGDEVRVSDIRLSANKVMRLEGEFLARQPTAKEIAETLKIEVGATVGGSSRRDSPTDRDDTIDVSLKNATRPRLEPEKASSPMGGLDRIRNLEDEARDRERKVPMLEGLVKLGLDAEAFVRNEKLSELYPIDPETQLRWISLPLKSNLFDVGRELEGKILGLSRQDK